MRYVYIALALLLLVLQGRLWFSADGWLGLQALARRTAILQEETTHSKARNQALETEVDDLKSGLDALEARARNDLGMIRPGETFIRLVDAPETTDPASHSAPHQASDP